MPQKEKIIKCPKCKVNMEKLTNNKVVIDRCPKCGGVFLDRNEIGNMRRLGFIHYVFSYFKKGKV